MKILNYVALLVLIMMTGSLNCAAAIKLGSAHIKIDCSMLPEKTADDITATIFYTDIFDDPLSYNQVVLDHQNNTFVGELPMELTQSLVALRFDRDKSCLAIGYLDLTQGDTIYMKVVENGTGLHAIDITPKTELNSLWMTDKVGEDSNLVSNISQAYIDFASPCIYFGSIKKEDFDNWQTMSLLQQKVYNEMCAQSIDGVDITDSSLRHLIDNNFYIGFIGGYVLAYRKNAKEAYDLTVDAYPYEYYSGFLSELDLKENSFLRFPPQAYSPYYFTYQLLDRLPELNIKDNETIADWRARIAPVIEQLQLAADSEFYDFLVASCYIINIRESKLLDEFQINQLKENICDGLYEIIINENSSMQRSLKGYNAKDLTSLESFDLKAFIKEMNFEKPVVVDFWNTWCWPCLDARKQIDRMESDNPQLFEKVEILYISDESSPINSWEKVSKQFGKTHIRLSKSAIEKVMNGYGFTAIPTYLFFDKNGKLSYSVTGFPGEAKFIEELGKITLPTP